MGIKTKNFEFSSDFLNMSEGDFKAHMKRTRGTSAKEAKLIYKELHGDIDPVSTEASETNKHEQA